MAGMGRWLSMGVSPVISSSTLIISTVLVGGHDGFADDAASSSCENDQHHCSHECDGHETANDDFGSLHDLINSWDPTVYISHRDGECLFCRPCAL